MSRQMTPVVLSETVVEKERLIPVSGEVLVSEGVDVKPEATVAKGLVTNPELLEIRVSQKLGTYDYDISNYMLKKEGDKVSKDEVIAIKRSFFGRSTKICRAPIDGTVEIIASTKGIVLIRGSPILIEKKAHVPGKVVRVVPDQGAVVQSKAAYVQGVFGIGGEARGEVAIAVGGRDEVLGEDVIEASHAGKVVVGGSFVTVGALKKAQAVKAAAVVVGGMDEKDLTEFLGYELGTGVTGEEKLGLTLILTDGFGANPMREDVFSLLESFRGKLACVDGSTQIRTRMLRPEIILPIFS